MQSDAAAPATTTDDTDPEAGTPNEAVIASGATAAAKAEADHRRLIRKGLAAHRAGRLEIAAAAYDQALALAPRDPDGLHLYGTLLHQQGVPRRGVDLIRQAIELRGNNPVYHVNLARALMQTGAFEAAERACDRALAIDPGWAIADRLKAELLARQAKLDDAIAVAERLVRRGPGDIEAVLDLIKLYGRANRRDAILAALDRAIRDQPKSARLWLLQGRYLLAAERRADALESYRHAADLDPTDGVSRLMVARLLMLDLKFEDARELVEEGLSLNPELWPHATDIAQKLRFNGYRDAALELLWIIRRHCPDIAQVEGEIGIVLWCDGNVTAAESHIARSLELAPDNPVGLSAMGSVLCRQEKFEDAITVLEKAVKLDPEGVRNRCELIHAYDQTMRNDKASLWSRHLLLRNPEHKQQYYANCLMALLGTCDHDLLRDLGGVLENLENAPLEVRPSGFLAAQAYADTDAEISKLMQMHKDWGYVQAYRTRVAPMPAIVTDKSRKKIRIGILSSDLRGHSVMKFVSPLIDGYDRNRMELYCYSPYIGDMDDVERLVRDRIDRHMRVGEMGGREVIRQIRGDNVDILLELNGLTRHSRLPMLVDRGAPVQIEWLGYPFTTGLEQMDYLLTDRYLKPANPDYLYESAFEMLGAWICFGATCAARVHKIPPYVRRGHLTFGSFNNMYKYSPKTLDLWSAVLRRVPDATLMVCRPGVNSIVFQSNFSKEMARRGVDPDRLEFLDSRPADIRYDECYNLIDISLDTSPLTGGTTTVDSLDMGVPVISLVGPALHQRISYAVMNHVGCQELCADTPEEYVDKAVALATNLEWLHGYRMTLRRMVRSSVLCDWAAFNASFQHMVDTMVARHNLR